MVAKSIKAKPKAQVFAPEPVVKAKASSMSVPAPTKSAKVQGMRGGMSNIKKTGRTPKV
jgi:hypothetical protein